APRGVSPAERRPGRRLRDGAILPARHISIHPARRRRTATLSAGRDYVVSLETLALNGVGSELSQPGLQAGAEEGEASLDGRHRRNQRWVCEIPNTTATIPAAGTRRLILCLLPAVKQSHRPY